MHVADRVVVRVVATAFVVGEGAFVARAGVCRGGRKERSGGAAAHVLGFVEWVRGEAEPADRLQFQKMQSNFFQFQVLFAVSFAKTWTREVREEEALLLPSNASGCRAWAGGGRKGCRCCRSSGRPPFCC